MNGVKYPAAIDEQDFALFQSVQRCALERKAKLYLVGGFLRDVVLKRRKENPDIDFAVRRGAIAFARHLAEYMHAGFFVLDKANGAARVVKKTRGVVCTFDFTDFRGPTIEEDLRRRDFTINALAADLISVLRRQPLANVLIDPLGGFSDLSLRRLRMAYKDSFKEDPLRILRAFSLSSQLGFSIDPQTLRAAARRRRLLGGVSGERVRDELFKILACKDAHRYIAQLDGLKILEIIVPECRKMRGIGQGPYHHLDVWQHTLETLTQLDGALDEFKRNGEIQGYLNAAIAGDRRRSALLRLTSLLHDIGKPATMKHEGTRLTFHGHEWLGMRMSDAIMRRLKLSGGEIAAVKSMIACHLRPGFLSDTNPITPRAIYRFFRDSRGEAAGVLLVSLADQRATRGRLHTKESHLRHEKTVRRLLKEYFKKTKETKKPRLVDGHDVMRALKLASSPIVGKILAELAELQAIGSVTTKGEALAAARKILVAEAGGKK